MLPTSQAMSRKRLFPSASAPTLGKFQGAGATSTTARLPLLSRKTMSASNANASSGAHILPAISAMLTPHKTAGGGGSGTRGFLPHLNQFGPTAGTASEVGRGDVTNRRSGFRDDGADAGNRGSAGTLRHSMSATELGRNADSQAQWHGHAHDVAHAGSRSAKATALARQGKIRQRLERLDERAEMHTQEHTERRNLYLQNRGILQDSYAQRVQTNGTKQLRLLSDNGKRLFHRAGEVPAAPWGPPG